ncbi:MAG: hypothetical protein H6715_00390 [Myxococcales bacterium]|nr:hypothetical protein [Myxococcales bacterium]
MGTRLDDKPIASLGERGTRLAGTRTASEGGGEQLSARRKLDAGDIGGVALSPQREHALEMPGVLTPALKLHGRSKPDHAAIPIGDRHGYGPLGFVFRGDRDIWHPSERRPGLVLRRYGFRSARTCTAALTIAC